MFKAVAIKKPSSGKFKIHVARYRQCFKKAD